MRVIVAGLGIQGHKRLAIAGSDAVTTVDPVNPEAKYKNICDVPLDSYDSALLCVPDQAKFELLTYLASNGKHALVEKPMLTEDETEIKKLQDLAGKNKVVIYTAYNHRFEPHFIRMRELIQSGELGKLYMVRFFYGNGTARDVRNSAWRDKGAGVLPDLGSHLLDTALYMFEGTELDPRKRTYEPWSFDCFENKAYDHVLFGSRDKKSMLSFEATLLSWRNSFYCDVYAENGSAHINCLCKWGPSHFIKRKRVLPSGRPTEEPTVLEMKDPTWAAEYDYFKKLCKNPTTNLGNDLWINSVLNGLA